MVDSGNVSTFDARSCGSGMAVLGDVVEAEQTKTETGSVVLLLRPDDWWSRK